MPINTKNGGAYAPIVGASVKRGGAYAAVVNIFAKIGGVYYPQLNLIYYNTYSIEVLTAVTTNSIRAAVTDSKRSFVWLDNPSTNLQTFEYALSTQDNSGRNVPASGWVAIAPGARAIITASDATRQIFTRIAAASTQAVTAATTAGTTGTFTVANHGITVGATAVRSFEGVTPSGYNLLDALVTATDANTVTATVASGLAAATAFGYMINGSECMTVTTGTLP